MFMHLIPAVPGVDALDTVASRAVAAEEGGGSYGVGEEQKMDLEGAGPGEGQTLILVGSIELAEQARAVARRLLPDWSVELEQAKHVASGFADM